jgi:hypothetical protein
MITAKPPLNVTGSNWRLSRSIAKMPSPELFSEFVVTAVCHNLVGGNCHCSLTTFNFPNPFFRECNNEYTFSNAK